MKLLLWLVVTGLSVMLWHETTYDFYGTGGARLSRAAMSGDAAAIQRSLEAGAAVDGTDLNGCTALVWASAAGDPQAIRLLLDAGANPRFSSHDGVTPLIEAARMGHVQIARQLLTAGADPNEPSLRGDTALYQAAEFGQTAMVKLLLENGAHVNQRSRDGRTPLIGAAGSINATIELVQLLITAGADASAVDDEGHDARRESISCGRIELLPAFGHPDHHR